MARPLDRNDPAQATAVLNELVPDEGRRALLVRTLAALADIAAGINPASWSITLQHDSIRLNVGTILVFGFGRNTLRFAVWSSAQLPANLAAAYTAADPFSAMPGVVLRRIPQSTVGEPGVGEFIAQASGDVVRDAATARGPWRRAHSPGVVHLLERTLGRRLAWEPPGDRESAAPAAAVDRDEAIRLTAAEPDARRERRAQAIDTARALIDSKRLHLDESDLRQLLALFNQDFVDGRERRDRFKTGLVGNNANLLVSQLHDVNVAISILWGGDDAWLAENLAGLRASGAMPGGGWLFPTMILHTRRPDYYMPLTESMVEGLAALDGRPAVSLRTGRGYLEYCERLRALLGEHGISPHFADILVWNAQRKRGTDAGQEPDEPVPQHVAPSATPPASPPVTATGTSPASPPVTATGTSPASPPVTATATPPASPPVAAAAPAQPAAPPTQQPVVTLSTPRQSSAPSRPSAPAKPATTRGSIGWLHLTDLHAGMQGTRWLWPNVLATVFDDLARLHDQCGPWDLVLFTGDLTQRGSPEEFAELDRTFERLWRRFEQLGSRPRLIAVPGNHDLQRPKYPYDPVPLALSRWHELRDLRNYVVSNADNPYILELRKYFAAYTEWAARAPWFVRESVTQGVMPGDIAASLSLHGIEIGIVGLNSTFLQLTGHDYSERLDVHPRQLEVCGDYAPEWLQRHHINLLLTHHPPEWLEPRARQEFRHEIDAPGRFAAHFYGHMHEGTATATRHGGGPTRHAIQGASLFGLEEYDDPTGRRVARIHGYTAGRFEPTNESGPLEALRVRIFPRKMLAGVGGRRIAPDHAEYELDDRNSFTFQVPTGRRS
ncbi:metallophosphoesterase [Nannocystis sp. SCPEA4]|uniref:metallophosphoesterase family protein n=1 Tax=Nannocystis sp. SCPEA4 TaxID=2996787 RepID=UPI002271DE74|nr:metallophosphoesterase [Nannocystis sp. SCPEA4]MCY1057594.1 metallophosphoesterase [Nannocystis sp. SCPEA4]